MTYDSVMKHKTHTVEASGAGKDRATDRIQRDGNIRRRETKTRVGN